MGVQLYKNNAASTLNGTISSSITSINLAASTGSRFPSPSAGDYFLVTLFEKNGSGIDINYEVVKCTARTADNLTVVRDVEAMQSGGRAYPDTLANNPSGVVYIEMRATAALFDNNVTKDMKDISGGYAGLTLYKVNMRNVANTFTSFLTNTNTAARTYTFPDKDLTVAGLVDLPTGGTPALTLGTTNAAGSSPNFLRRDDTILIFDATSPSTQAYGDAAAVGVADVAARRDHKHAMPASTKDTTAVTGILKGNGTAVSAATANTDYLAPTGSDAVVTRQMTKDMGIVFLDKGNSGTTAQTIDYTAGSHQKLTVTGAFVMNAVTNWPPTGNTGEVLLELVNGASSAITWTMAGTTQKWWKSDGTSVATIATSGVTLQAAGTDWILMWSTDAGTTTNFKVMR